MNKKFLMILSLILVLGGAVSLPYYFIPFFEQKAQADYLERIPMELVAKMSLEEKVGQVIHVGMPGKTLNAKIREEIEKRHIGGVILFAHNLGNHKEITRLNSKLQKLSIEKNSIPLLISVDQEGGRVYRLPRESTTQFPGAMSLGQTGDKAMARDLGFVTGYELLRSGFNLVLAPVLDVNNNPSNPVINTRSFGAFPEDVAGMGMALAQGIRESGSIPCIKHFPGHGDTFTDSHLALPRINKPLAKMQDVELLPFRRAIKDGAEMVMSAHILYNELDPENPATLSPIILKGLLRKDLGFKGVVMTDAMEMHAISKRYTDKKSVRMAFQAGADIILLTDLGAKSRAMFKSLLDGFKSGELSVADLDIAVARQLSLKIRKGIYNRQGVKIQGDEVVKAFFAKREAAIEKQNADIRARYKAKNTSLNAMVSRGGISSLRKPFEGLKNLDKKKVHIFYRSGSIYKAAVENGIPAKNIRSRPSLGSLKGALRRRAKDEVWLVEIRKGNVGSWNGFQSALKKYESAGGASTLALYYGNPFLTFQVPGKGAILAAFSPTRESRKALVYRALDGKPVRKAKLILPELK